MVLSGQVTDDGPGAAAGVVVVSVDGSVDVVPSPAGGFIDVEVDVGERRAATVPGEEHAAKVTAAARSATRPRLDCRQARFMTRGPSEACRRRALVTEGGSWRPVGGRGRRTRLLGEDGSVNDVAPLFHVPGPRGVARVGPRVAIGGRSPPADPTTAGR